MSFRVGGPREAEDAGGGDGDTDPMGDDRFVGHVAGMFVARILARNWVAHAVAEMDARVSETHASQCGSE